MLDFEDIIKFYDELCPDGECIYCIHWIDNNCHPELIMLVG